MPPCLSGGHRRGPRDSHREFPDRSLGLGPSGQRRASNLLPQARPPSKIPDGLYSVKTPASVSLLSRNFVHRLHLHQQLWRTYCEGSRCTLACGLRLDRRGSGRRDSHPSGVFEALSPTAASALILLFRKLFVATIGFCAPFVTAGTTLSFSGLDDDAFATRDDISGPENFQQSNLVLISGALSKIR
ncbi:hypothetical protein EVAR_50163_1 [Eumeta japonica]|uniref:Uncharacterized protein n=1 Tax=Eumeta variegata TaxID=151549 RepID=A0A4C1SFN0_EUMVA|nr:hypothetical protein EVAR_50163_1 [Eumeta japonica]